MVVCCVECNPKYNNNYNLIFQIRQELHCLDSYNSKRHTTFIISISTELLKLPEPKIFYKMQCFVITKNMNILWEMTLVLYIVAYFLKYSILPDRKC